MARNGRLKRASEVSGSLLKFYATALHLTLVAFEDGSQGHEVLAATATFVKGVYDMYKSFDPTRLIEGTMQV